MAQAKNHDAPVNRNGRKQQAKKWQGRLSRKQSIALPNEVNARGLLTGMGASGPTREARGVARLDHFPGGVRKARTAARIAFCAQWRCHGRALRGGP